MVWFVWALLGAFFSSLEGIIDKKIVIKKEKSLDGTVASFYRNIAFYIFILLFGFSGLFGSVTLFIAVPIIIWAFFHVISSIIYDYFLKNSEIIRYNAITFVFPIFLILTDKFIFSINYSALEIIGFFLLIIGGYTVTLDGKNRSSIYSSKQWLLLFVSFLIVASQYGLFKYYNNEFGINEVSFYISAWIFVTVFFIIGIFIRKKQNLLLVTATKDNFFVKTLTSKFFDSLAGLFLLKAVSESSLSKVYSLESISPLITLILVVFLVSVLKIDMKEKLDRSNLVTKSIGIGFLCIGGYLIV